MLSQHFKFFKMLGIQVFTPNITQHSIQTVPTCWMQHLQYPTLTIPNIVFKRCQHVVCNISSNMLAQHRPTSNIIQHCVQTVPTCCIQNLFKMLAQQANITQHHPTCCSNGHNMLDATCWAQHVGTV